MFRFVWHSSVAHHSVGLTSLDIFYFYYYDYDRTMVALTSTTTTATTRQTKTLLKSRQTQNQQQTFYYYCASSLHYGFGFTLACYLSRSRSLKLVHTLYTTVCTFHTCGVYWHIDIFRRCSQKHFNVVAFVVFADGITQRETMETSPCVVLLWLDTTTWFNYYVLVENSVCSDIHA